MSEELRAALANFTGRDWVVLPDRTPALAMLKARARVEAYALLDMDEERREFWRRMLAPQDAPEPTSSEDEKEAKS